MLNEKEINAKRGIFRCFEDCSHVFVGYEFRAKYKL
jgi:hypothetical protein